MIDDLHKLSGIVSCSRKSYKSLHFRIKIASAAIYRKLTNFGIIYTYSTEKSWSDICTAIRSVVKGAGLDQQTPREIVYGLSLGMEPKSFARKLLIVMLLKKYDIEKLQQKRCLFQITNDIKNRPNQYTAASAFNEIDSKTRTKIVDYLIKNGKSKKSFERIKDILKEYYSILHLSENNYKDKSDFIKKNLKKYRFSYKKIDDRIKRSEKLKQQKANLVFNSNCNGNTNAKKKITKTRVINQSKNDKSKKSLNNLNEKIVFNDTDNMDTDDATFRNPDSTSIRVREMNRVTRKNTRKK